MDRDIESLQMLQQKIKGLPYDTQQVKKEEENHLQKLALVVSGDTNHG